MKDIINNAKKIISEINLENIELNELFYLTKSQILLDDIQNAKNNIIIIFNKIKKIKLSHQTNYNITILELITKLLKEQNKNKKENQNIKKEITYFLKIIKYSLKNIKHNFCEDFLLIKNNSSKEEKFNIIDNSKFLSIIEDLVDILNENHIKIKQDQYIDLKNKIELGFNRYLYNKQYNILIFEFNKKGEYTIANICDQLKILNYYIPNEFDIKSIENIKVNKINHEEYIPWLSLLKNYNIKKYKLEYNKNKKRFKYFGEKIISKKEFDKHKNIINSINKEIQIKNHKINQTQILINIESLKIMALTLNLIK